MKQKTKKQTTTTPKSDIALQIENERIEQKLYTHYILTELLQVQECLRRIDQNMYNVCKDLVGSHLRRTTQQQLRHRVNNFGKNIQQLMEETTKIYKTIKPKSQQPKKTNNKNPR